MGGEIQRFEYQHQIDSAQIAAQLAFAVANSTAAEPSAGYDAIFAMAVLRHGSLGRPGVSRSSDQVRGFCARNPGSRALPKAQRTVDHPPQQFSPVRRSRRPGIRNDFAAAQGTTLFGPDNRLISDCEHADTVFRKKLNA